MGLARDGDNQYGRYSPLTYVANVYAPLLILHSDNDTCAPIDQTLQEFNALKISDALLSM